jgi:hypothetical protein
MNSPFLRVIPRRAKKRWSPLVPVLTPCWRSVSAQLAQVGLRLRLARLQDHGRMRLDAVRAPLSAHRPGGDLTLLPKAGLPADGGRRTDAEALGRLAAGRARLDGRDGALAQVDQQGPGHDGAPAKETRIGSEPAQLRQPRPTQTGRKQLVRS